jgi:hypothetical protein
MNNINNTNALIAMQEHARGLWAKKMNELMVRRDELIEEYIALDDDTTGGYYGARNRYEKKCRVQVELDIIESKLDIRGLKYAKPFEIE